MKIPNVYENKNYKFLFIVPALLIVIALALVFFKGVPEGVDLKGGLLVTVFTDKGSTDAFKAILPVDADVRSFQNPTGSGFEIELPNDPVLEKAETSYRKLLALDELLTRAEIDRDVSNASSQTVLDLENQVSSEFTVFASLVNYAGAVPETGNDKVKLSDELFSKAKSDYRSGIAAKLSSVAPGGSFSFKEIGSSLSKFFLSKTREILFWSFVLSAIAVFVIFRKLVPSFAVIFGAATDIILTLGAMVLFNIPLTLASIAALLMLVGFSLDTDVMLTVRVLKRKEGTPQQRAWDALKTGTMMNFSTVAAFGVLTVVALVLQIPTYFQIGAVAVIGGIVDFIATWAGNATIVLWSLEAKKK